MSVTLAQVPVGALEALADHAPKIKEALAAGKTPAAIVAEMEPVALSALNFVAGLLLPPPFGTALGIMEWVFMHRRPMTREEEEVWFNRETEDMG
jgi:hypothetical protein